MLFTELAQFLGQEPLGSILLHLSGIHANLTLIQNKRNNHSYCTLRGAQPRSACEIVVLTTFENTNVNI